MENSTARTLVQYNQAVDAQDKKCHFKRLSSFKRSSIKIVDADQYEFYDKWYNAAIRELFDVISFVDDYRSLATLLVPSITPAQAEKAVRLLERLGLVKKDDQGVFRKTDQVISTGTEASSMAINHIVGFPLLVRPFECGVRSGECGVNGRDVCFVNAHGATLAYEIERWDSAASLAEVWVRVDTIRGNSVAQWIDIRWGNDTAVAQSNGAAVFDADGFAGVWHFTSDNPTKDATAHRNDAIDSGTVSTVSIIGTARGFDGASYLYIPDTVTLEPRSITISAWVSVNEFEPNPAFTKIIQKGKSGYGPKYGSYTLEFRTDSATIIADLPGFQTTNQDSTYNTATALTAVTAQKWVLLTGTFDATTGTGCMYVDGILQRTFTTLSPIDYYPDTSFPVTIGCQFGSATSAIAPQSLFTGMIDEVRICSSPQSAAWVRLEYESQRPGSNVVEWR